MKQIELLDVIGNVDEDLLTESEELTLKRHGPILWKVAAVAAVFAGLAVTAFAAARLAPKVESRPIRNGGVTTGTVSPFEVDNGGNILLEPVTGWQVTMDVEFDEDAPETLEEVYRLLPSAQWEYQYERVRDDDLLEDHENLTVWTHGEYPGQLRFHQYVSDYHGLEGENVVDSLHYLPMDAELRTEIVTVADRQVLKVTIPAVKIPGMLDQNAMYCEEGEIRLYWTDGKYLLQLDYPAWMPEKETEAVVGSLYAVAHVEKYPEHWGRIDPERLAEMTPNLVLNEEKTGTTAVNDTMTVGMMAREENVLYLSASGGIWKYEIGTGRSAFLETGADSLPRNLFLTENYICYADNLFGRHGLYILSKDGTKHDYVYEGIRMGNLHVVGNVLYGVDDRALKRIDLKTGEIETVAENVNRYYVDEDSLYILPWDGRYFLKSAKEELAFEKVELSFQPISMVSEGGVIYFTVGGKLEEGQRRYQVVRYEDGVEKKLPVYALRMQVLDGKLIYESDPDSDAVKSYDLETGEVSILQENVFDFYVCRDGMIVFHYLYTEGWGLLDRTTGELTKIENCNP